MLKTMSESDVLTGNLKDLGLPTMRRTFAAAAVAARANERTFEQYLLGLSDAELSHRRENRIGRLLRASKLPLEKSWAALDTKRLPTKVVHQAKALLDGGFVDRRENVLVFGPPGSGKTHLLCAVAQELVRSGRKVLFTTCNLLVQELLLAKRELKLHKALKRLGGYPALMVDDLGYVQQSREEMEVLFTLLAERYERGSVLLTSNLAFSGWESIFKDPMTTAAAIDRLVHHSVIVELNVPSYRAEQAKSRRATTTTEATT
jgi:DNA replication protein DnaC